MSHAPHASACPHCGEALRLCGKCDRLLPVAEFYACNARPDGLQWACKACQAAYKRDDLLDRFQNPQPHVEAYEPLRPARLAVSEARGGREGCVVQAFPGHR